ncbi:MAG: hypothetical protein MJY99_12845, partial [Fibrobacter sp.]|nr:hypothetical protein [Fibrobacter sp.]
MWNSPPSGLSFCHPGLDPGSFLSSPLAIVLFSIFYSFALQAGKTQNQMHKCASEQNITKILEKS